MNNSPVLKYVSLFAVANHLLEWPTGPISSRARSVGGFPVLTVCVIQHPYTYSVDRFFMTLSLNKVRVWWRINVKV